jgi:hypothetical protein
MQMKVRCDFVSNSSSSSFIVGNPADVVEFLSKVLGIDDRTSIPYAYDKVSFTLVGSEDTLTEIKLVLDSGYICESYSDNGMYELSELTFMQLLSISKAHLRKCIKLIVSTEDDYDELSKLFIGALHELLSSNGFNTEDNGEIDISFDDDAPLLFKIFKKIGEKDEDKDKNKA